MKQTLKRVKKLSEYQPVSEKEYLKAIKVALANLIDKYQDGTPMSRKRIAQLINVLRRELKIPTDKFIQSFHRDLLNEIWDDYRKSIDPSWFQLDKEGVKALVDFKELYWHRVDAQGKHYHTLTVVDKLLRSVANKINKDTYAAIVSGYVTGVHPNDIAMEILQKSGKHPKDIYNTARRNLRATVRTMYSNAQNKVQMQMLKDNQDIFEYYEYTAKLDQKTTEICRSLDEKKWYSFDDIPKDEIPSLHFNCRSIIVGIVG